MAFRLHKGSLGITFISVTSYHLATTAPFFDFIWPFVQAVRWIRRLGFSKRGCVATVHRWRRLRPPSSSLNLPRCTTSWSSSLIFLVARPPHSGFAWRSSLLSSSTYLPLLSYPLFPSLVVFEKLFLSIHSDFRSPFFL